MKKHSKVIISIIGNNPNRFILRLNKNNINVYKIVKIDNNKYEVLINYSDFDKVLKIKTIYEIRIEKYLGIEKGKRIVCRYYHVLLFLFLSMLLIVLLSNTIFSIEVITNDSEMKKNLLKTLETYDIKKYKIRKNYDYLMKVKDEIMLKYHDQIEWIEIERKGTKYIVKYEPRIITSKIEAKKYGNIIAKKNGIINKIYSSKGQIIKHKNSYVKKGDIIISGDIITNNEIKATTASDGLVYGNVWYITKVVYPFNYYEINKTGRKKNILSIKFINSSKDIFNFHPFNDKIVNRKTILKNKLLPIKFVYEKQEEVKVKSSMNVVEELRINAISLAYTKIQDSLNKDEYIVDYKVLDSKIIDKGIEMKIFFNVCEQIGEYQEIIK